MNLIESDLDRIEIEGYDLDSQMKKTNVLLNHLRSGALDLRTRGELCTPTPPIVSFERFDYFVTIAFPDKHLFNMKYEELTANGPKVKIGPKKFRECTSHEQYNFISRCLVRHISMLADKYDIFYEQHKTGDLHLHGRIKSNDFQNVKNTRITIHRMFGCPMSFTNFVDIKVYDHNLWKDYDQKKTKNYQTTAYPHFANI